MVKTSRFEQALLQKPKRSPSLTQSTAQGAQNWYRSSSSQVSPLIKLLALKATNPCSLQTKEESHSSKQHNHSALFHPNLGSPKRWLSTWVWLSRRTRSMRQSLTKRMTLSSDLTGLSETCLSASSTSVDSSPLSASTIPTSQTSNEQLANFAGSRESYLPGHAD